jgi:RNA polymerase sigma factor (sigma-70 family)
MGGKTYMDSMEQIYLKYANTVYGFLLTKSQNPDLAEELTQETFFQAVKNVSKFKGNSSVSTWLCGIAKNLLYQYLRKQKYQVSLEESEGIPIISAETKLFCDWDNLQILKSLHNLEDPMREVMYLRLIGNLTFGQIGEIMEKSENWARVTFYRGKERIIKEVEL